MAQRLGKTVGGVGAAPPVVPTSGLVQGQPMALSREAMLGCYGLTEAAIPELLEWSRRQQADDHTAAAAVAVPGPEAMWAEAAEEEDVFMWRDEDITS